MTREEAIAILEVSKHMATSGRMYNQAINMAIEALQREEAEAKGYCHRIKPKEYFSADAKWIPCSERLPKEDEYVGNVCKYYLIQDEYGDMHVAHLSGRRGWETIESVKALGCDVVAWMPLPTPYGERREP